jgi:ribosomal protein L28
VLELRKRRRPAPDTDDDAQLTLVSILANNAPDLDIVYIGITGGKLGYLLHHRGHTHTLVATLVLVPICGKVSMGGFNPQSSGMNRVRAHRRYQPNLQPLIIDKKGVPTRALVCTRCRRTQLKSAR